VSAVVITGLDSMEGGLRGDCVVGESFIEMYYQLVFVLGLKSKNELLPFKVMLSSDNVIT
jgi:hypothetical protein